jgi:hypothetical protein
LCDIQIKFKHQDSTGRHYIQNYYKWLDYHADYEQMNETETKTIDNIIKEVAKYAK